MKCANPFAIIYPIYIQQNIYADKYLLCNMDINKIAESKGRFGLNLVGNKLWGEGVKAITTVKQE